MAQDNTLQAIIAHAKEYGFIFPSSEIYDGLSAVYDYGPLGAELKRNLKDLWWTHMTQFHEDIVGIDSSIFMHPKVWKASGHVDSFNDPMIDNRDSKKRYRVDHLIEDYAATLPENEQKALLAEMEQLLGEEKFEELSQLINNHSIVCPISKTSNWTEIRQFNLMFSTKVGSVADESSEIYLRPETAQGIFVNFLNVQKSSRLSIPFGIAQIGKAFRNEIVARGFIFRMREFEQMEMQYFIRPGSQKQWYEYWKEHRLNWHVSLGIPKEKLRYHDHVQLSHYADMACDIEYEFPMGFRELEGIHSRTDFDLKNHQEHSRKKLQYFDQELNEEGKPYGNYIPYVLETSVGLDRLVLMILSEAFEEEDLSQDGKEDSRSVLRLAPKVAPIKLAILPLTRKDGLPEIAKELYNECKLQFKCFYEEKATIGRRYRRMDALGTPFCVTVDHQTKEDGTVTIRYRDSMEQERIPMNEVKSLVMNAIHS